MQRAVEDVHVCEAVGRYIVDVVRATRESARLQVGSSPRGTLALIKLSAAGPRSHGRDYVVPDDVKALAAPALAHRLTLQPGAVGAAGAAARTSSGVPRVGADAGRRGHRARATR